MAYTQVVIIYPRKKKRDDFRFEVEVVTFMAKITSCKGSCFFLFSQMLGFLNNVGLNFSIF